MKIICFLLLATLCVYGRADDTTTTAAATTAAAATTPAAAGTTTPCATPAPKGSPLDALKVMAGVPVGMVASGAKATEDMAHEIKNDAAKFADVFVPKAGGDSSMFGMSWFGKK